MFTIAICAAATADGQVTVVRIIRTGDPLVGEPELTFGSGISPAIDARGRIALDGGIDGPGVTGANNNAVFYGQPGNMRMILRERDPVPQLGDGVSTYGYLDPIVAQSGTWGLGARLRGTGIGSGFNEVLMTRTQSGFQLIAREGDTPPDVTDGSAYNTFGTSFAMGRGGHVAYWAGLGEPGYIGSPVQSGLWAGPPDNPRLIARTGAQAPGTPPGVHFSLSFLTPGFTINRRGAVAFPAPIAGPGVDASNDAGVWAGTHADLGMVMRAGDPAPVPGGGVSFIGDAPYALINGNDRVLFFAYLTGAGITGANNSGLWAGRAGGPVELVARRGDEVPLLGSEYTITDIYPFVQTEDDRVVIVTTFTGPGVTPDNDQAIFFGGPGNWELLFREGDPAPGLPDGIVINFNNAPVAKIAIVESGAAGMLLGLGGNGVTAENDEALFWRPNGDAPWQFVVRDGEPFDGLVVGDSGLVLRPNGGGEGSRPSINDRGDLVFGVVFEGEFPDYVHGSYLVRARPSIVPVESSVPFP